MRKIYFFVALIILASCENKNKTSESLADKVDSFETTEKVTHKPDTTIVAPEVMDGILNSIPSPIEVAALIRSTGSPFFENFPHDADLVSKYETNFQKAINLGIYTTDLGYVSMYNKPTIATVYVHAMRQLSEYLKVSQFYDVSTFKKAHELSQKKDESDSIVYFATHSFEKMNSYLNEKNRRNISTLILTGSWLEALYLAAKVTDTTKGPELRERVGEQKISLDNLRLILSVYHQFPEFSELIKDFDDLKVSFDKVNLTYTYGEPTFKEENGMLVVQDKSTSAVEISVEVHAEILSKVSRIRNRLTR